MVYISFQQIGTYFQFKVRKAKAYCSLELSRIEGLNIERPLRSPPSPDLSSKALHSELFSVKALSARLRKLTELTKRLIVIIIVIAKINGN